MTQRISHEERRNIRIQRSEAMAVLYRAGMTLEQIGQQHGITRERVRQLLAGIGVTRFDGGQSLCAANKHASYLNKTNARSIRLRGMPHDEFLALPRGVATKYREQRRNANTRGIEWKFSLASWWGVWQVSGKWGERGRGYGYVMARKFDDGPYAPDNVYICTGSDNARDSYLFKPYHSRKNGRKNKYIATLGCSLMRACKTANMPYGTVLRRIKSGMGANEALTKPIQHNNTHLKRLSGVSA